jgi:hypothetical protein
MRVSHGFLGLEDVPLCNFFLRVARCDDIMGTPSVVLSLHKGIFRMKWVYRMSMASP